MHKWLCILYTCYGQSKLTVYVVALPVAQLVLAPTHQVPTM